MNLELWCACLSLSFTACRHSFSVEIFVRAPSPATKSCAWFPSNFALLQDFFDTSRATVPPDFHSHLRELHPILLHGFSELRSCAFSASMLVATSSTSLRL